MSCASVVARVTAVGSRQAMSLVEISFVECVTACWHEKRTACVQVSVGGQHTSSVCLHVPFSEQRAMLLLHKLCRSYGVARYPALSALELALCSKFLPAEPLPCSVVHTSRQRVAYSQYVSPHMCLSLVLLLLQAAPCCFSSACHAQGSSSSHRKSIQNMQYVTVLYHV